MDILKIIKMTLVYMRFSFQESRIWKICHIFNNFTYDMANVKKNVRLLKLIFQNTQDKN